jgi:cellobiose phosphorylase
MLGITPQSDGLRIDPCLPKSWNSAKIVRKFRGDTFEILINKEVGICKGKVIIELNGSVLDDNIICGRGDGSCHRAIVTVARCPKISDKQEKLQKQVI